MLSGGSSSWRWQSAVRSPAVRLCGFRPFAELGGFMSYWFNGADIYRRIAVFVDEILKGAKPGDLPVQQPAKFQLVIQPGDSEGDWPRRAAIAIGAERRGFLSSVYCLCQTAVRTQPVSPTRTLPVALPLASILPIMLLANISHIVKSPSGETLPSKTTSPLANEPPVNSARPLRTVNGRGMGENG